MTMAFRYLVPQDFAPFLHKPSQRFEEPMQLRAPSVALPFGQLKYVSRQMGEALNDRI